MKDKRLRGCENMPSPIEREGRVRVNSLIPLPPSAPLSPRRVASGDRTGLTPSHQGREDKYSQPLGPRLLLVVGLVCLTLVLGPGCSAERLGGSSAPSREATVATPETLGLGSGTAAPSADVSGAGAPTAPSASSGKESGTSTSTGATAPADAGPETASGQRAYEHVRALAEKIGTRPTGTDSERAAADYISSQLKSYGYSVTQQRFSFPFFKDNGSILEVVSPSLEKLNPKTMFYSSGGQTEGPLAFAGLGRAEDVASVDLAGKVALLERGQITFEQKAKNVASKGAVGAVVYNNQAGEFQGSLGSASPVPVVAISKDDGEKLRGLLGQGAVSVRLVVDAGVADIQSQNVVATPGKPCTALVGGHYDSVSAGPGANDNASGTAVVMEVARAARSLAFKEGFCFAAFGGEELGLWGSRKYVESLSVEDKAQLKVMINLDMVGVGDRWGVAGSEAVMGMAVNAAEKSEIEVRAFSLPRGQGSDHASFINADIPSVFIHRQDDPNYHTPEDKAEFVDPAALEQAAKIAVRVLEGVGGRT